MTRAAAVVCCLIAVFGVGVTRAQEWTWNLPSYVPAPRVPADNPMSEAKFQLGRFLFYDTRLSATGAYACASCHRQELAFTDGRAVSPGSTGEITPRNAQPLANAAWNSTYTWANTALVTLERQMEVPLFGTGPVEMGINDENRSTIVARIASDKEYQRRFQRAFPNERAPLHFGNIIKAIAAFERGLVSFDSRYDSSLQGRIELTPEEARGRDLFFGEKAECHHCHGSFNLNDQVSYPNMPAEEPLYHNTGLYNIGEQGAYPFPNRGLYESSGRPEDMGAFRAPSLRNVAVTAPYMHDGSVRTLEEVVNIYARGGRNVTDAPNNGDGGDSPHKDGLIASINFSQQEKSDLVAFLKALTDSTFLTSERFSNPFFFP